MFLNYLLYGNWLECTQKYTAMTFSLELEIIGFIDSSSIVAEYIICTKC